VSYILGYFIGSCVSCPGIYKWSFFWIFGYFVFEFLDFSLWKIPIPNSLDSYKIQNQPGGKHIKSWIFPMWFSYDFGTGTVAVKSFSRCWPLSTAFFSCRHRKFDENWIFLTLTIIGSWTITTIYSNRRWPLRLHYVPRYCTCGQHRIVFKNNYFQVLTGPPLLSKISRIFWKWTRKLAFVEPEVKPAVQSLSLFEP